MSGRPDGFFDTHMQLRATVCFHCKKCKKKVRKSKILSTLAPWDMQVRAAIMPLLKDEATEWERQNSMFCDDCRPASWRPDKWLTGGGA